MRRKFTSRMSHLEAEEKFFYISVSLTSERALEDVGRVPAEAACIAQSRERGFCRGATARLEVTPHAERREHPRRDLRVARIDIGDKAGDEAEACAIGPRELRRVAHAPEGFPATNKLIR